MEENKHTTADRVEGYLDRLVRSRNLDHERIHGFDVGEPSEAVLLASDLRDLLDQRRELVEALERIAYGDGGIGTHRAIAQQVLAKAKGASE